MDRYLDTKIASILGIFGNILLLIIKAIIGFITKSQAMIADATNSAGDIFSSLFTYIGNRIASKPSDDDHNLGHGKAEYIFSMIISIIIMFAGLSILKSSFVTLIKQEKFTFSIWLIIVCVTTILVKFSLFIYTNALYKKNKNILIKANSIDHRNDCILTTCNLISCILSLFNIYLFDSIVGIGISVWMVISAIKVFVESFDVLMDTSISTEKKDMVLDIVKNFKEIKKIEHFNSTPVGYKYQISLTIYVDGNLSTFESHNIADKLEKELVNKIDDIYLAVIHVNPI